MKKLFAISLLAVTPFLANAQTEKPKFMGINSMPITEEGTSVLLSNAIKSKDWGMLERWDKERGLKTANSGNEICYVNYSGQESFTIFPSQKPFNKDIYPVLADQLSAGNYPFFTNCTDLIFVELLKHTIVYSYNPTTITVVNSRNPSRKTYEEEVKWLHRTMDNLTADQWPQLITAIVSPNQDYTVRTKAAEKFVEFYNQEKLKPNENQEKLLKAIESYRKDPKTSSRADRVYFDIVTNPAEYAYQKIFFETLPYTKELRKSAAFQQLFSKDFFTGAKTVTLDDIQKASKSSGNKRDALRILTAHEMMKTLAKTKDFNINRQDIHGNTMFHKAFSRGNMMYVADNRILANWLRAFWEDGANPLLLNKENKTPYMIFETTRSTNSNVNYAPIIESFTLQEYNY